MQSTTNVSTRHTLSIQLAWLSAGVLFLLWISIRWLGDLVWWTLPLLYGPRWIAGVCFAGLLPALYLTPRHAVRIAVPMLLVFGFGILDFNVPVGRLLPAQTAGAASFRVLQLNAGGGRNEEKISAILAEIARLQPQVMTIVECSPSLARALQTSDGWQVYTSASRICFASRWPVQEWRIRDPRDFWKMNGAGAIASAIVTSPQGTAIRVGVVHLETPREALQEYFDISAIPTLGTITRNNIAQRELESEVARGWIFEGDAMPTLVSGDFNLPVESAIYRRHWGDLTNAFSHAGFGTGATKLTRLWGSRIDHVLATPEFSIPAAGTGRHVYADHLPVFADFSLPPPSGNL